MNVGPPLLRKLVLAQESRMSQVALAVVFWCGLDREPLRQIRWRDIDLERGTILVTRRRRRAEIVLPDHLRDLLREYAADQKPRPTHYLIHWQRRHRAGTWPEYRLERVEKPAHQLSASAVYAWWRKCCRNAHIDPFPMSDFRHTPLELVRSRHAPAPTPAASPPRPAPPLMGGRVAHALAQAAAFLRRVADRLDARSRELHSAAAARAVRETAVVIAEHVSVTLRRTPPRNSA